MVIKHQLKNKILFIKIIKYPTEIKFKNKR